MIEISFVKVRLGRACLRSTMTFHKKRNNSNYILVPCSHAKMANKINSIACNPKLEVTFACFEYTVTQKKRDSKESIGFVSAQVSQCNYIVTMYVRSASMYIGLFLRTQCKQSERFVGIIVK